MELDFDFYFTVSEICLLDQTQNGLRDIKGSESETLTTFLQDWISAKQDTQSITTGILSLVRRSLPWFLIG
jgi:hypothetical protein